MGRRHDASDRSSELLAQVPILKSFELPPTIVMPYVDGLSLEDALRTRSDIPWLTRLDIGIAIGKIVGAGHALPQTILHRDLKPSNIMISNFEYQGSFDPEVVVLDFDMSWHKGSREKDVVFESRDDFGYLAPEQTDAHNRYTARSTRVDSYGYGMTLFYIFGREPPRPNEALSEQWRAKTIRSAKNNYDGTWKSAPFRVGRTISKATEIDQNMRIDFASIVKILTDTRNAVFDPSKASNPEIWAEEILCNMSEGVDYEWDDARSMGSINYPSGISVRTKGNFRNESVLMEINYTDTGIRERGNITKYLNSAVESAERTLRDAGWSIVEKRISGGEANLKSEGALSVFRSNFRAATAAPLTALNSFRG